MGREADHILARIAELCRSRQVEAQDGSYTDADDIWPSEIMAIIGPEKNGAPKNSLVTCTCQGCWRQEECWRDGS